MCYSGSTIASLGRLGKGLFFRGSTSSRSRPAGFGTVIYRAVGDAGWNLVAKDFEATPEQVDQLGMLLKAFRFPEHAPHVDGIIDSSDSWYQTILRVALDSLQRTLDLNFQCSGYDGDDAEGLRALFRHLTTMAGAPCGYELTGLHVDEILPPS